MHVPRCFIGPFRVTPCCTLLLCVALFTLLSRPAFAQFIYVANAGEDTVSKIDINLNIEVARYGTAAAGPTHGAWYGAAPSRIASDSSGNVYVLNRYFGPGGTASFSPCPTGTTCQLPVLLKILPSGGICGTTTSCTSTPLPFNTDVRVAWAVPVGNATDKGALGRALCIDPGGNLWVGLYWTGVYYKVDSVTGHTLAGPIATPSHTPYGCVVDASGMLWSASEDGTVAEINTNTNTFTRLLNHSVPTNYESLPMGRARSPSRWPTRNPGIRSA